MIWLNIFRNSHVGRILKLKILSDLEIFSEVVTDMNNLGASENRK